ncbi:sulfate/molybdate ABC transporter ATP-binding protein [Thermovibrio sp.]
MIKVKVEKRLKDFHLSLSFSSKEKITALFAPSGSGKSLTLKAIAGLVKPERGRIEVKSKVLFDSEKGIDIPPQKRKVGFLFQDYALFPHLTVEENVAFGAKEKKRVRELLRKLKIEKLKEKYPDEISGGEKQRVALARALASEPEILLLDEPFSALDSVLKEELYREVKRLIDELNIPSILVSHDINEIFRLSERVVILKEGKKEQEGKPEEVFYSPKSKEVAKLLGHRSFIPVKVVGKEKGKTVVELPSGRKIKCRNSELKPGEKGWLSILPSSISLSTEQEFNKVEIVVEKVERDREVKRIYGTFEGEKVELSIPAPLSPNFQFQEGRASTFYLSVDHLPLIRRDE